MIRRTVLLAAVLAAPVVAAPASAQSEHGAFITRLGDDTLAV
jgi:hypothetical protein